MVCGSHAHREHPIRWRCGIKLPVFTVVLVATALASTGCRLDGYIEARSPEILRYEQGDLERPALGMARFLLDDFGGLSTGTLETSAMPWKVVITAMVMEQAAREGTPVSPGSVPALLQRYGWITADAIDNWPGTQPRLDKPLGFVSGELVQRFPRVRLEVANIGCAACHAGVTYDANGDPTGRVWLGLPNTSRSFNAYAQAILSALRRMREDPEALLAGISKVFPHVHPDEIKTIRRYVLPLIADRLDAAERGAGILAVSDHGGPGLTNGIAALKLRLDLGGSGGSHQHGFTSIPDLHGRLLRSSLLYDGLYTLDPARRFEPRRASEAAAADLEALAGLVAFFLVPSMGAELEGTDAQTSRVADVLAFVKDYVPPPFPGPVDSGGAQRGSELYAARCAGCHGQYTPGTRALKLMVFPNRLVPHARMASDPERWQTINNDMVQALSRLRVAGRINPAPANGYVAPILSGLWATAPYLHNGSVPTLWHLLNPEDRPAKFMVGGHKLDFDRVGIAGQIDAEGIYRYPTGYRPWSDPELYDTAAPGRANAGHEAEFRSLSGDAKRDLIEFLKLL